MTIAKPNTVHANYRTAAVWVVGRYLALAPVYDIDNRSHTREGTAVALFDLLLFSVHGLVRCPLCILSNDSIRIRLAWFWTTTPS